MTSASASHSFTYSGHKVLLPVALLDSPGEAVIQMVLDTGASVTTLSSTVLPMLGITDVRSGQHVVMSIANDDVQDAWIHPVRIEFMGREMIIDVAFCPAWPHMKNLLGMRGFFDQMRVTLDHANRIVHIEPNA